MMQSKKLFSIFLLFLFCILSWHTAMWYGFIPQAYASVTVTPATGGSAISADKTGGTYTTLTGPTLKEGANRDFPSSGTIILNAPTGFVFNTGVSVTATVTRDSGTNTCFGFASTTVTPTSSTITFTFNGRDASGSTTCHVTFSNIQVRPSSGTPLASGNITNSGTAAIVGLAAGTNLGALTEVVGAKNKLIITAQPSTSAVVGTDFITKPAVQLQDQFGNAETGDSTSTVTITPVLSTSLCGGAAGSGSITATPTSGAAITNGVMTYTAMQYSAAESIKLCFSSTGVTSALSNAITVGIISISITSSGTVSYGFVPLSTTKDTTATGLNSTQTAQNSSTIAEDFNIQGQNTACPWTLAATSGANQYVHAFSINSGTTWTPLTTNYQSFITNIAAGTTQNFDLQLTMPTTTTCYNQQAVNVTIQAVAH